MLVTSVGYLAIRYYDNYWGEQQISCGSLFSHPSFQQITVYQPTIFSENMSLSTQNVHGGTCKPQTTTPPGSAPAIIIQHRTELCMDYLQTKWVNLNKWSKAKKVHSSQTAGRSGNISQWTEYSVQLVVDIKLSDNIASFKLQTVFG